MNLTGQSHQPSDEGRQSPMAPRPMSGVPWSKVTARPAVQAEPDTTNAPPPIVAGAQVEVDEMAANLGVNGCPIRSTSMRDVQAQTQPQVQYGQGSPGMGFGGVGQQGGLVDSLVTGMVIGEVVDAAANMLDMGFNDPNDGFGF